MRRVLIRHEASASTPIIDRFCDTTSGLTYIRASKIEKEMKVLFDEKVEQNINISLLRQGLETWLQSRMGILSIILVEVPCFAFALLSIVESKLNIVALSLFITQTNSLSNTLRSAISNLSQVEGYLISVERCYFFDDIKPEKGYTQYQKTEKLSRYGDLKKIKNNLDKDLALNAKESRNFQFESFQAKDLWVRYFANKRFVVKNLSFEMKKGQKIGVIGRTGSGKSTLVKVLWRALLEQEGSLLINQVEFKSMDLKSLRRKMTILGQESPIFLGTLKENLDCIGINDESQITRTLAQLNFNHSGYQREGLDFKLDDSGSNLSAGERQIICLARALLSKNDFIIFDEATASIDVTTEALVQKIIDERFKDKTMIVIAHRLSTIMECDSVLMLEQGELIESGNPKALLEDKSSRFYKLSKILEEEEKGQT